MVTGNWGGVNGGFVLVSTDDADDASHCGELVKVSGVTQLNCGNLYANAFYFAWNLSRTNGTQGILAIGLNSKYRYFLAWGFSPHSRKYAWDAGKFVYI